MARAGSGLRVHYFASARDAAGCNDEPQPFVAGEDVAGLRVRLTAAHPGLAAVLPTCRLAINDDFARDADLLSPGDEIYVLPPVSGGAGGPVDDGVSRGAVAPRVAVLGRLLTPGEACAGLATEGAGAVVTFTGVGRRQSLGREVQFLDFEAHVPLAEKELTRILREATERFGLTDARVLHRTGRVGIGEVAVDIAVSAPHRAEAFEGCRYVIDQLKDRVPIWKRETDAAGSTWVTPTP